MKIARTTFWLVFGFMAVLLLNSCSIVGGSKDQPKESFYDIPYYPPKFKLKKPLLNGVLGIARPETDGVHDNVRILFSYSNRPYSVEKHNYHLWQDAPTSIIQKRMRDYFADVNIAKKVVLFEAGENVDYIVRARLDRLERFVNVDNGKDYDEVVFGIEIRIVRASDFKVVLPEKYIETRIKSNRLGSIPATIYASVKAFGKAVQAALTEYIQANMPKKRKSKKKKVRKRKGA